MKTSKQYIKSITIALFATAKYPKSHYIISEISNHGDSVIRQAIFAKF